MGSDATGILAYGYDLGPQPTFVDIDEYDTPGWWTDQHNNFKHAAEQRLLDAARHTDLDTTSVQIVRNSCDEAPTWILAAKVITGEWGGTRVIHLPELAIHIDRLDARLAWAVEALGIQPAAEHPDWLLTADYG